MYVLVHSTPCICTRFSGPLRRRYIAQKMHSTGTHRRLLRRVWYSLALALSVFLSLSSMAVHRRMLESPCVCVCVCVAGPPIRPHCIRGAEHHSSCRMRVWSSRPRPVWTSGTLAPGMPSNCLLDEALPCKDSETSISRVKRYPLIHDALCRCACRIRTTRLLMRDPRSGVEALGRRIWPDGTREHRLARGAPERLCQLRTP